MTTPIPRYLPGAVVEHDQHGAGKVVDIRTVYLGGAIAGHLYEVEFASGVMTCEEEELYAEDEQ